MQTDSEWTKSDSITKDENLNLRIYLPPEALQGEEVPSFALWKGLDVDEIRVKVPDGFVISEVYNSSNADWNFSEGDFLVRKTEVKGYIGFVMTSEQLKDPSKELEFHWEFLSGGKKFSETRKIHVFRPLLHPSSPNELNLGKGGKVSDPLVVRNLGLGTVIVGIRHLPDSDARVEEPKLITEIRKSMYDDFRVGFSELKKQFPSHQPLIDALTEVVTEPSLLGDEQQMAKYRESLRKIESAALEEEEFVKGVGEVLATAIFANLTKYNFFQQLAEYLLSIAGMKLILTNPLDVLRVRAGKSSLGLTIDYTDLAQGYYHPIELRTTVSSAEAQAVPIYKLLQWAGK